jgi:hypothetical protein
MNRFGIVCFELQAVGLFEDESEESLWKRINTFIEKKDLTVINIESILRGSSDRTGVGYRIFYEKKT